MKCSNNKVDKQGYKFLADHAFLLSTITMLEHYIISIRVHTSAE